MDIVQQTGQGKLEIVLIIIKKECDYTKLVQAYQMKKGDIL